MIGPSFDITEKKQVLYTDAMHIEWHKFLMIIVEPLETIGHTGQDQE
jgi:hypothetical protein